MPAQAAVQGCNGPLSAYHLPPTPYLSADSVPVPWGQQIQSLYLEAASIQQPACLPMVPHENVLFRSLLPPFGVCNPERTVIPLLMSEGIVPSVLCLSVTAHATHRF